MKTVLNIGCGYNYMDDAMNIDINPNIKSDSIIDISNEWAIADFPGAGSYEKIIAHDVLEHIVNLKTTMTNCLYLLKEGGIMDIIVPYDLSFGAWQDPTHVRAFNERSWLYYDEWCWYLGWKEYKFKIEKLEMMQFDNNPFKPAIIGARIDPSLPRRIDAMHVILRKVKI